MEQLIAKVPVLPPEEQERFAVISSELEDEQLKWDEALAGSQEQLGRLADEALREFEDGKTAPLDFSSRRGLPCHRAFLESFR